MLKVLHLASGDLWAGAEVQLFHLSVELAKNETDVLVVLLNDGELAANLRKNNIKVEIINESKYGLIKLLILFNAIVKNYKPDIIHTHRTKENLIGAFIALKYRVRCIRTVHGASELDTGLFNFKRWVLATLDVFIGRYLQNSVIAVSDELNDKLRKYFSARNILTINNSINIDYVIEKSNKQCDFIVDKNRFNIAFVGRLVPVKRVDYFIEMAEYISALDRDNDYHFYIIGDGPLYKTADRLIQDKNLQSVITLTGFVDNVAPVLKQVDLLAITSDHEGLPMILLEAMALNVPVISRHLPTIKQVLCSGECGFVQSESANAQAISSKIVKLASNKDRLSQTSKMAFDRVLNNYSLKRNVIHYLDLYKKLLD